VEFTEQGPQLPAPLRGPDELARVQLFDPTRQTDFVLETIGLARAGLGSTPLIGFAGAPFTVATYAIEGKTAKNFTETKKLFYRHPQTARRLLDLIGRATQAYLEAQIAAGVAAVQLFDSWVGVVSVDDWNEFVFPPTAALIAGLRATGVPVIYFGNGATTILDRIAALGADVYGIDWRLPLDEARARLGAGSVRPFAVQGNLDPAVLLGPIPEIERRAAEVVARGGRRGHIFNLGHGITPETPIESVEALVRAVHQS
jgi:uroporphyrinogen decarboxylase